MSGSLGSNDIEDVVSSVRRLVSVDARPRPVSRDLGADRLILTPALQIVPDPLVNVPLPEISAAAATEVATSGPLVLLPSVSGPEPEPLLASGPDVGESDVSSDVPAAGLPPLHLVEDDWEEEIWSDNDMPLAELALGAEDAELVLTDPDVADPDLLITAAEGATTNDDIDKDIAWAQGEGDWADDMPDPLVSLNPMRAHRVSKAEASESAPLRGEPVELTDPDGNPLTILDEAALQEVIRQLIREELQGSLGERITRNVRKLVRAEINRALTARALD